MGNLRERRNGRWHSGQSLGGRKRLYNNVLQLTICLVTARACARSAPSQFAVENNVFWTFRMDVHHSIRNAEAILPGTEAPEGAEDPRWQAIIGVAEFIQSSPEEVWTFIARWGNHEDEDLRAAIATCLLEHLLESHFDLVFARVEHAVRSDRLFADTLSKCWKFGEARRSENSEKIDQLLSDAAR